MPAGTYTLKAVASDNTGATASDSIAVTVTASRVNVALAANGATAHASSVFAVGYEAAAVNNGDRRGLNYGNGAAWKDSTPSTYPDWVEVTFAAAKTISEIDVFSVQDNYLSPSQPTATMTGQVSAA